MQINKALLSRLGSEPRLQQEIRIKSLRENDNSARSIQLEVYRSEEFLNSEEPLLCCHYQLP